MLLHLSYVQASRSHSTYAFQHYKCKMHIHRLLLPGLLSLIAFGSFGDGLLRRHCQVLEKKYFLHFTDVKFESCERFSELDFTIAVSCNGVEDLHSALKGVPQETGWLCLDYQGLTMEAGAFSQFTNLKSLYIRFSNSNASEVSRTVVMLSGTFKGLTRLSTLWIKSKSLKFHEDTFRGLDSLQELKISDLPQSAFNFSLFSNLNLLEHLILDNNFKYLSDVTTQLEKNFNNLRKLSVINLKTQAEERGLPHVFRI